MKKRQYKELNRITEARRNFAQQQRVAQGTSEGMRRTVGANQEAEQLMSEQQEQLNAINLGIAIDGLLLAASRKGFEANHAAASSSFKIADLGIRAMSA
jgi:hypothetical protein